MKKIYAILTIIILALTVNAQNDISLSSSGSGIVKTEDSPSGFRVTFSFDKIVADSVVNTETGNFSILSIADAFSGGEIGEPALPIFKKMMAVPVGATPKVVLRNYSTSEYNLSDYGISPLLPKQPSVIQGEETIQKPLIINEQLYSSNEYTASGIAEANILGTMRGVRIGMLTVHPLRYNPVANSLIVYNDIEVEVIFENADMAATQSLYQATYSPYFESFYKSLFNRGVYEDHPDLYQTPVRMLVIANRMFEQALQPWIQWKAKKGFYMDVNYTDNIGTTANAIKTFCQQRYNTGVSNNAVPTFVMIIGDVEQVPPSATGTATGKVTDLYYASVDGDMFPDMYYSRLSAETPQQLSYMIEKILYYEQYQFEDVPFHFLDNALFIAGIDETWNVNIGRKQMQYAINNYFNEAHGYKYVDFCNDGYCPRIVSDMGYFAFMNYAGHCMDTMWTYPQLLRSNIPYFDNQSRYNIIMGNCNLSANFGYETDCLGEAMIRAEKKGVVAYIGSAANTFWYENFHFITGAYASVGDGTTPTQANSTMGFYDAMFLENSFNSLSSQVFAGNLAVTYAAENGYPMSNTAGNKALYYWEAYNILGDGSITPILTQSDDNEVSHPLIFPKGANSYQVHALPGSYVAVSRNGVLHGTAIANASGIANVPISPLITTDGNVDLVVTLNQRKPYITQLPAAPATGPFIAYEKYEVGAGSDSLTYISANETLSITLKNLGNNATTSPLNVSIQCSDPNLVINNGAAQCGTMATGETQTADFKVTVKNNIEDETEFTVKVTASNAQGSWTFNVPVMAYAPKLLLEKVLVNGSVHERLQPSDTASIITVLKNAGHANAYNISGKIAINDPHLAVFCTEETLTIGDLSPNENKRLIFAVTTDAALSTEQPANIALNVNAEYGITYTSTLFFAASDYQKPEPTNCTSGDKIACVELHTIDNQDLTCTFDGHSDFSNKTATLGFGSESNILWLGTASKNNYVRVWIDWNGNKVFEDNESRLLPFDAYMESFFSCSFIDYSGCRSGFNIRIPDGVEPGSYRMRIRLRHLLPISDPYSGGFLGQTHDYTVIVPERYSKALNAQAKIVGTNNIFITWTPPLNHLSQVTGYDIYRNGIKLNTTPLSNTSYTDTEVPSGMYIYSVVTRYGGNSSLETIAKPICLDYQLLCNPPENVAGTADHPKKTITVTWKKPSEVNDPLQGYNIYRNSIKQNTTLLTGLQYIDSELAAGVYQYYVTAVYKSCEESGRSNIATVELKGENIIEGNVENFHIFPNPAENTVTIQGKDLSQVAMYDLLGKKLAAYNVDAESITINGLEKYAEGIYLIKMYQRNGQSVVKKLTIIP